MKVTIPTPCKEKLQDDNFCAKCQHKINDFSNLSENDLVESMQKEEVYCGIFHPSQLGKNLIQKTISNVMIFSALGLITSSVNAQDKTICAEPIAPKNDSVQYEKIAFKLIVSKTSDSKVDQFSTFRLLINGELIEQTLKVGEEYTIKCDVQKGLPIDIRLASNENNVEITKNYTKKSLPKKVKINSNDFIMEPMIKGDISIEPTIQGIIAIKK